MSNDKPFRFQPKKIDANELSQSPSTPIGPDQVQAIQAQMGREGLSVKGNLPPALQQLLNQRVNQVNNDEVLGTESQIPPQTHSQEPNPFQIAMNRTNKNPERPVTASPVLPKNIDTTIAKIDDPALDELLAGLNTQNYERITLPSLGKVYNSPDTPMDGTVEIRPMTGKEEAILSSARLMLNGQGIEMILKNCIKHKGLATEKLINADREFLLVYLRAISYGHIYEVRLSCPNCSYNFDYNINLNLNVDYCDENWTADNLIITLPASGYSCKYRLMTGEDEAKLMSFISKRENNLDKNPDQIDDIFSYKASMLIEWIGNENAVVKDQYSIHKVLENLLSEDYLYLKESLVEDQFGVQQHIEISCPNCTQWFKTKIPYNENFFSPKVKAKKNPQ